MKAIHTDRNDRKHLVQSLALLLMLLPAIGLYFSVEAGADWATWLMMGLIFVGNMLALCIP